MKSWFSHKWEIIYSYKQMIIFEYITCCFAESFTVMLEIYQYNRVELGNIDSFKVYIYSNKKV